MNENPGKYAHQLAQWRIAEHRRRHHMDMPMRNRKWKRQRIRLYYAKITDKDLYQ